VMLFPLSTTCHGFNNYYFRIGWRTQTKIFPWMKFTIVPAFYNKPDYLQNLADSIKGHLKDMITIIFYLLPRNSRTSHWKTDITKSHCKIDGSCCNTPSQLTNFATVTSVMKQLNK
jgi:hypothetical protein